MERALAKLMLIAPDLCAIMADICILHCGEQQHLQLTAGVFIAGFVIRLQLMYTKTHSYAVLNWHALIAARTCAGALPPDARGGEHMGASAGAI